MIPVLRAITTLFKRAIYGAAKITRLNQNWGTTTRGTQNGNLRQDARAIRARSQQIYRDNPMGRSLIESVVTKTVASPMIPRSGLHGDTIAAAKWRKNVDRVFRAWANDKHKFSLDGMMSLVEMERAIVRAVLVDGECFVVFHERDNGPGLPALRLEMVEAEFLNSGVFSFGFGGIDDKGREGLEVDEDGRAVRYHFRRPNGMDIPPVPADRVLHIKVDLYAGQYIGEPAMAPIADLLYHFDSFQAATIKNAENCAKIFMVATSEDGSALGDLMSGATADNVTTTAETDTYEVGFGQVVKLLKGESVTQMDVKHPGSQYAPFVEKTYMTCSATIGVPYEVASGDFRGVNYSTSRMSDMVAEAAVKPYREMLRDDYLCPIFQRFMSTSIQSGLVPLRADRVPFSEYLLCNVTMPGRRYVDPEVEIKADAEAMKVGVKTWSQIQEERGNDPEEQMAQIIKDREMFERAGLTYPGDIDTAASFQQQAQPAAALPQPDDEQEEAV